MKNTESWRWSEIASLIVILSLLILIITALASRIVPVPFSSEISPTKTSNIDAIAAHGFTTAFTFTENAAQAAKDYQDNLLFRVVLPLAAGIIGLVYAGALLIYSLIFKLKPKHTTYRIAIGAVLALWVGIGGLTLFNVIDAQQVSNCAHLQNVYNSKQYRITEGIVHVLHTESAGGHDKGDMIAVGNVKFEVSYYVSTCAYKQSIAHGGALTEGTDARIYYTDYRTILRIDVKNQ
jgi:hypothetical protein